jgi:hypothetical protein
MYPPLHNYQLNAEESLLNQFANVLIMKMRGKKLNYEIFIDLSCEITILDVEQYYVTLIIIIDNWICYHHNCVFIFEEWCFCVLSDLKPINASPLIVDYYSYQAMLSRYQAALCVLALLLASAQCGLRFHDE